VGMTLCDACHEYFRHNQTLDRGFLERTNRVLAAWSTSYAHAPLIAMRQQTYDPGYQQQASEYGSSGADRRVPFHMMASFVPAQSHQQMLVPMPNSDYMQHHAMYTLGQPQPSALYGQPAAPRHVYARPAPPSALYGQPAAPRHVYARPAPPSAPYGQPAAPRHVYARPAPPSALYGQPRDVNFSRFEPRD